MLLEVPGECGGRWQLVRTAARWSVGPWADARWDARVTIPPEIAWRVFTKGISRTAALDQVRVEGDRALGLHVLELTAIVA